MCSLYDLATFSEIFTTRTISVNEHQLRNLNPTTFKDKIKYLRLSRGLTQLQFAKLLHKGFGTITKWEQNLRIPNEKTIEEISKILEIDSTYLKDQG